MNPPIPPSKSSYDQLLLWEEVGCEPRKEHKKSENNKIYPEDRPVHDWYRFVLSFPPHLVRAYLQRFQLNQNHTVLDPFCGTGTTLVECKKLGIASRGIEANRMAHFAGQVKTDWSPDPGGLRRHASRVAKKASAQMDAGKIEQNLFYKNPKQETTNLLTLPPEQFKLLLKDSISPLPLHKILVLRDTLKELYDERYYRHELLALAKTLVYSAGNLCFGPEVGVGVAKVDAPVLSDWMKEIEAIADDLQSLKGKNDASSTVFQADAREINQVLEPDSVDAVITSPPYPNEKDYTRTTRLESVVLGFIKDKEDLRLLKKTLVRSNTRGVYKNDADDQWISNFPEIQRLAETIESKRIELGKTSGFERMYHRVTRLYFGGMAKHLAALREVLRRGAWLAYVVGDQASYLRVKIQTGFLLADIAKSLGYEVAGIDLFRTRLATATKEQLREEVVILRWSG